MIPLIVLLAAGTVLAAASKAAQRAGSASLSDNARQRVRTLYSHSLAAIVAVSVALFLTRH